LLKCKAAAKASAQVDREGILQRARSYADALIFKIVVTVPPEEPVPQAVLQEMALYLNDEARRNQWDPYSRSYSEI